MAFTSKNLHHAHRSGMTFLKGATFFFLGMSVVMFMTQAFEIVPSVRNAKQYIQDIVFTLDGSAGANTGIYLDGSGGNAYFAGKVGIGTDDPNYALEVDGIGKFSASGVYIGGNKQTIIQDGSNMVMNASMGHIILQTNTKGNNVGIGITPSTYKLEVNGTGKFNGVCLGSVCKNVWPEDGGDSVWSTGTSKIYYTGGSVGIGTTGNSTAKLEIASVGNASNFLRLTPSNGGSGWLFQNEYLTTGTVLGIRYQGTTGPVMTFGKNNNVAIGKWPDISYALNVSGAGNFSSGLIVDGNVGIGKTIPTAKLHVYGSLGTNEEIATFESDGGILDIEKDSNSIVIQNSKGADIPGHITDAHLEFRTARWDGISSFTLNENQLFLHSSGNVGIGTDAPNTTFHVRGNITDGGIAQRIAYFDHTTKLGLALEIMGGDESGIIRNKNPSKHLEFGTYNGSIYNDDQLFLHSSGSVGIGTESPQAKLHVAGGIKISNSYGDIGDGSGCDSSLEGTMIYKRVDIGLGNEAGRIFVCMFLSGLEYSRQALSY